MMSPLQIRLEITASPAQVWTHITTPARMQAWMGGDEFQLQIELERRVGGTICLRAFHLAPFENRGTVLAWEPEKCLQYETLDTISRLPHIPENRTRFTYELRPLENGTLLQIEISNFPTETIYHHLEFYWRVTQLRLKEMVGFLQS